MKILALDLGKFNTMCCLYDSKTRKHSFLNVPTDRGYLSTIFKKHKVDLVVMEACGPSGWINDLAVSHGHKTLVCSTNEDAWSWSNVKRKTDKDDALKLARMAAMGELNELWKGELDYELTQMDALSEHLAAIVKKLEAIGKADPRIVRLRTIPGVGPRTAEILVACIDDPNRFKNGRQVSAYFGLVPRQYQSGETDRNGRITKRGNPLARTILVECAWASLRYNPWAKAVYDRICGKQKTRKKKAAIALARKIAVVAWAMLKEEKDWDPNQMLKVTASYCRPSQALKKTLQEMKPKENSDQRKSRLRKEARATKEAAATRSSTKRSTKPKSIPADKNTATKSTPTASKPTALPKPKAKSSLNTNPTSQTKPRRARKLVSTG